MNDLHNAYATLGVPLGSSMETITRRYKRLIMVWHPDRAHTPEQKEFAEEELKKINNAKDLLTKHFGANGGHRASGCTCQPNASSGTGGRASSTGSAGPGPGPAYHRNKSAEEKYQEEQAAKKRDADRKAREEAEANAKRAQEQYKQQTSQQTMDTAMQQQAALQDEKLRWKISIGIVIAFIVLEIFGSMAVGAKHWVQDTTRNWKWPTFQSEKPPDTTPPIVIPDTTTTTDTATIPDTIPVPVEVKEDPCSLPNPTSTPPKIILPNLHNWVRQSVTQWSVNCQGDRSSGTITGRDEKERLVVSQEYGRDWSIIQQWTFSYGFAGSGETVSVDLYKPAFDFVGRSIYAYDQDHNVIEIRQLDGHQRAVVTATIQRRPGGAYYQTILKFFELATGSMTDTRTLYDSNDPYMSSTFYQYGMLGSVPKTVTSDPIYTSPFTPPADPNSTLLTPSTTPSFFKRKGLDGLSTPSTSTPSLSELLKKNADPLTAPSTKSFFDKKYGGLDSLSTPSSSTSNLSDLLKKYKSDQQTTSSPSAGGP